MSRTEGVSECTENRPLPCLPEALELDAAVCKTLAAAFFRQELVPAESNVFNTETFPQLT